MLHSSPVAELRHFGLGQAIKRVSSRCPAGPDVPHRKQDPMTCREKNYAVRCSQPGRYHQDLASNSQ